MEFKDSNVGSGGGRAAKAGTLDRFLQFFSPRRTSEVSPPTQRPVPPLDSTLVPTPSALSLAPTLNDNVSSSSTHVIPSGMALRTSPPESRGPGDSDSEISFQLHPRGPEVVPLAPAVQSGVSSRGSPYAMGVDDESNFLSPRQVHSPRPEGLSRSRASRASSRHSANLAERMYDDLADIMRRQSAEKEREKQSEREKFEKEMQLRLDYERRLAAAERALVEQKYEYERAQLPMQRDSMLTLSPVENYAYVNQRVFPAHYAVANGQAALAQFPATSSSFIELSAQQPAAVPPVQTNSIVEIEPMKMLLDAN